VIGQTGGRTDRQTPGRCFAPLHDVINKTDCLNKGPPFRWINYKYNFDDLGQVRMDVARPALLTLLIHAE